MPLLNKVGDDGTASTLKTLEEGKALVEALMKVVACYRHLASCVGGCTDGLGLRDELRRTREKAQGLALSGRQHLTARLRDKGLGGAERTEAELLWVSFSSSLELLHADMCKVCSVANRFPLSNDPALVQTGIQGGTREVAARALSLTGLSHEEEEEEEEEEVPEGLERTEQSRLEEEIAQVDRMIEDMEQKVNVLRWTVEARGPRYADPSSSTDSASLGLLSTDEEEGSRRTEPLCRRSQALAALLLCAVVALAAAALSVSLVYF